MTTPLRIETLTLCDYRAFPGPAPWSIELGGKNLLVYGENGAGKSSIFHALSDFFSRAPPRIATRKNVFSSAPNEGVAVSVTFDDGGPAVIWGFDAAGRELHPARAGGDARVFAAAQRRACLDYRALLDTNYGQGDGEVNLFTLARERLLPEFEAALPGGETKTVAALWEAMQAAQPKRRIKPALDRVNAACLRFSIGFRQALDALRPKLATLLPKVMARRDVTIDFAFGGVTWNAAGRSFEGERLRPDVTFRGHAPDRPQHFLNEARLSGLGLAMYLAGRLATVPAGPDPALKLLVLDDVLIGLDQENRRPLLDVIRDDFADWQVVLLTHDLYWFDAARVVVSPDAWNFAEILDQEDVARRIPFPALQLKADDAVRDVLRDADNALAAGHVGVAANRVRVAWEALLRRFCEKRGVPVAFDRDARKVKTEALRNGLDRWASDPRHPARVAIRRPIADTFSHSRLLNDGSHDPLAAGATAPEVRFAIDAVRALETAFATLPR